MDDNKPEEEAEVHHIYTSAIPWKNSACEGSAVPWGPAWEFWEFYEDFKYQCGLQNARQGVKPVGKTHRSRYAEWRSRRPKPKLNFFQIIMSMYFDVHYVVLWCDCSGSSKISRCSFKEGELTTYYYSGDDIYFLNEDGTVQGPSFVSGWYPIGWEIQK